MPSDLNAVTKQMIRRACEVVACMTIVASTCAQHEPTLHFMSSLPQAGYNNPAFQPRYAFSFGLPGSSVYAQYANNGFTYRDAVTDYDDSIELNLHGIYSSARGENYITAITQADLLRFEVRLNARAHINWNVTTKVYSRAMIPKGMLHFMNNASRSLRDNESYDLPSASVSPSAEALAYVEGGLGGGYIVNKKLTVGARIKLLKGIANGTTRSAELNLEINDGYATANADFNVATSGVNQFEDDDFDIEQDWEVFRKNTGFAFDLGGTYQLSDKLTIGVSLIDVGGITWKNDTHSYTSDPKTNSIRFRVTTSGGSNPDVSGDEALVDSLENVDFTLEESRIGKYRSPIPGRMYLSASYALRKSFSAGVVFFAEKFKGRLSAGGAASLYKEFGRSISTSLSYTVTNHSYNNIGLGISFNFSPVQLYIVGDNLLRAPTSLLVDGNLDRYIDNSKYVNVRAGLNFVFGWVKTQEKIPTPEM